MRTAKRRMTPSIKSSKSSFSANKKKIDNDVNHNFNNVINELRQVKSDHQETCKSSIKVLKVDPRTKFKRHFCVIAVPEFMERIHSLDFSNRIVFLNGTGNANRFNCSVFVPMVDSHVGALPLGFFISSNKSASLMKPMFRALNEVFPQNAFNTQSALKVILTGIENGEHISISKCFSTVKTYIGTFHLLRDIWKFLWDPVNCIDLEDRTNLFKLFEDIVHSPDEDTFTRNVNLYIENEAHSKYPMFQKYFSNLLKRKELWGLDFRIQKHVRYDKNVLLSEKHVLKEDILHECKGCSVTELFEFLCTVYCDYYRKKILDATNNIICSLNELRYMPQNDDELNNLKVAAVYSNEVLVVNTAGKSEFYVNRDLGTCSCVLGKEGSPCVHQYVVSAKFNSCLFQIIPMSEDQKCKYNYLADGHGVPIAEMLVNSTENIDSEMKDVDEFAESMEYVIVDEEVDVKEVIVQRCPPGIEDVCVQEVEYKYSHENSVQTIERQHSIEECVEAIETFWSNLSVYVENHTDQIYDWITDMNEKLGRANSFDDVLSTLHADTKTLM